MHKATDNATEFEMKFRISATKLVEAALQAEILEIDLGGAETLNG
jgi:F0F1-type ATP synthase gamma subunit